MDTRQLEYIIQISETRSLTRAAEKLFVTQSALSQQLQKLEGELGLSLFVRTRSDWKLTPAGELYVKAARQMLNLEKDTRRQIQDMKENGDSHISLGLIPERGVNMFTSIYPEFHRRFPKVRIEPVECNVRTMQYLITQGELDLGLMTLTLAQRDKNTYWHMAEEEIFLAVPADHPFAASGSECADKAPVISLAQFAEDSFVLTARRSTMFQLEEELFSQAGIHPPVLFTTISNISKHRMVQAGVGCALLPRVYAASDPGLRYFRPEGLPRWEITMCCRQGAYVSRAQQSLLALCRQYWSSAAEAEG